MRAGRLTLVSGRTFGVGARGCPRPSTATACTALWPAVLAIAVVAIVLVIVVGRVDPPPCPAAARRGTAPPTLPYAVCAVGAVVVVVVIIIIRGSSACGRVSWLGDAGVHGDHSF
jgi:hypothetical protein